MSQPCLFVCFQTSCFAHAPVRARSGAQRTSKPPEPTLSSLMNDQYSPSTVSGTIPHTTAHGHLSHLLLHLEAAIAHVGDDVHELALEPEQSAYPLGPALLRRGPSSAAAAVGDPVGARRRSGPVCCWGRSLSGRARGALLGAHSALHGTRALLRLRACEYSPGRCEAELATGIPSASTGVLVCDAAFSMPMTRGTCRSSSGMQRRQPCHACPNGRRRGFLAWASQRGRGAGERGSEWGQVAGGEREEASARRSESTRRGCNGGRRGGRSAAETAATRGDASGGGSPGEDRGGKGGTSPRAWRCRLRRRDGSMAVAPPSARSRLMMHFRSVTDDVISAPMCARPHLRTTAHPDGGRLHANE